MSMTEMAKQLAKQKNAENGPGLTRQAQEREAVQMEREKFQAQVIGKITQEVSRQIEPLSEAIAIQSLESRQNTADLERMSKRTQEELQGALERSRRATDELKGAIQGFTFKAITTLIATAVLIGVLSAYVCSRTPQPLSVDKEDMEDATHWRHLQLEFFGLSPAQQKKVTQLLSSSPKH